MTRCCRLTLAVTFCLSLTTSLAHAQATRTWVSGVGDDANPCSRTAPCKTFAGAISKTASGGEISVLDNGSFGILTITKPITINGDGNLAAILASGATNGILINITDASKGSRVVIRNISIHGGTGATKGQNAIQVFNGGNVLIDRVTIQSFSSRGVLVVNNGNVVIKDSVITFVKSADAASGIAVNTLDSSQATIENSLITYNNIGIRADGASTIGISNNSFYNLLTGFACSGGTVASNGNNRRVNIGGGVADCAPGSAVVVQ